MQRHVHRSTLISMLWLSLGAHAILAGLMLSWARFSPPWHKPPQAAIMTRLVRLGTPRSPQLLPQKFAPVAAALTPKAGPPTTAPAPPAVPKAVAAPVRPQPVNPVSARDRAQQLNRVSSALDRLRQKVDGAADGSAADDAAVAVAGDRYLTELHGCIKRYYVIEGIDLTKVAHLSVKVLVRVAADGTIINHVLETSSGQPVFDQAVARAVRGCGHVSPPPTVIRQQVRHDGVEVVFTP